MGVEHPKTKRERAWANWVHRLTSPSSTPLYPEPEPRPDPGPAPD